MSGRPRAATPTPLPAAWMKYLRVNVIVFLLVFSATRTIGQDRNYLSSFPRTRESILCTEPMGPRYPAPAKAGGGDDGLVQRSCASVNCVSMRRILGRVRLLRRL